jgi:hypothetical protein
MLECYWESVTYLQIKPQMIPDDLFGRGGWSEGCPLARKHSAEFLKINRGIKTPTVTSTKPMGFAPPVVGGGAGGSAAACGGMEQRYGHAIAMFD